MRTATAIKKWLPKHGKWAHFIPRDRMKRVARARASLPKAVPVVPVPIDSTGNGTASWPMDANDQLGICGPAMCDHINGIRSFGQGKAGFAEVHANLNSLISQYEQYSGGDNGTDEGMLVGATGMWTAAGGGLAGDSSAIIVDHLDVDITDVALARFCHDQFYGLCMAWSVPDALLQGFTDGSVWTGAAIPDPNNGHYTAVSDVNKDGYQRVVTWGASCWMDAAYIASVQPDCFVTMSPLQFRKSDGYDSKGRHVGDVAAAWVSIGGNASLMQQLVAQFPPKAQPTPAPAPAPTSSPTLAQAQQAVASSLGGLTELIERNQAIAAANAGLAALYGPPT